jgi:hypothetical protein
VRPVLDRRPERLVGNAAAAAARHRTRAVAPMNAVLRSLIIVGVLTAQAAAAQAKDEIVASSAAGSDGVQFQAVCERCKRGRDCLSVRAVGAGAPAGKLLLEDDSSCRGGGESFSVDYSAREFRLSPTLTGALIKQEYGGEGIAHHHWLVAIVGGKVRKLWDAMYQTHEVVPIDSYSLKIADADGNGRQEIDYTAPFPVSNSAELADGARGGGEATADTWSHVRLEYSDEKKAMVEKSPHEEYAAVLASLKTLNEAFTLKVGLLGDPKCAARDFLVLNTDDLPKLRKGFYVVAAIAESRPAAQAKLDRIKVCRPQISGAVRQVR